MSECMKHSVSFGSILKFRLNESISDFYELGKVLSIPSSNSSKRGPTLHEGRCPRSLEDRIIKIIKKEWFKTSVDELKWREIQTQLLSMPSNPHVLRLYDILEGAKEYYVVMDRCRGSELFDFLATAEMVPEEHCKLILRQVFLATRHLHNHGLIHRDIKPENIMFKSDKSLDLVLLDFDTVVPLHGYKDPHVSKMVDEAGGSLASRRLVGTHGYLPPEAYEGRDYSISADIWAVGVIFFILMAAVPPYAMDLMNTTSQARTILRDIRQQGGVDFKGHSWSEFPQARDLCQWLMEMEPELRPQSVDAALIHPWMLPADAPADVVAAAASQVHLERKNANDRYLSYLENVKAIKLHKLDCEAQISNPSNESVVTTAAGELSPSSSSVNGSSTFSKMQKFSPFDCMSTSTSSAQSSLVNKPSSPLRSCLKKSPTKQTQSHDAATSHGGTVITGDLHASSRNGNDDGSNVQSQYNNNNINNTMMTTTSNNSIINNDANDLLNSISSPIFTLKSNNESRNCNNNTDYNFNNNSGQLNPKIKQQGLYVSENDSINMSSANEYGQNSKGNVITSNNNNKYNIIDSSIHNSAKLSNNIILTASNNNLKFDNKMLNAHRCSFPQSGQQHFVNNNNDSLDVSPSRLSMNMSFNGNSTCISATQNFKKIVHSKQFYQLQQQQLQNSKLAENAQNNFTNNTTNNVKSNNVTPPMFNQSLGTSQSSMAASFNSNSLSNNLNQLNTSTDQINIKSAPTPVLLAPHQQSAAPNILPFDGTAPPGRWYQHRGSVSSVATLDSSFSATAGNLCSSAVLQQSQANVILQHNGSSRMNSSSGSFLPPQIAAAANSNSSFNNNKYTPASKLLNVDPFALSEEEENYDVQFEQSSKTQAFTYENAVSQMNSGMTNRSYKSTQHQGASNTTFRKNLFSANDSMYGGAPSHINGGNKESRKLQQKLRFYKSKYQYEDDNESEINDESVDHDISSIFTNLRCADGFDDSNKSVRIGQQLSENNISSMDAPQHQTNKVLQSKGSTKASYLPVSNQITTNYERDEYNHNSWEASLSPYEAFKVVGFSSPPQRMRGGVQNSTGSPERHDLLYGLKSVLKTTSKISGASSVMDSPAPRLANRKRSNNPNKRTITEEDCKAAANPPSSKHQISVTETAVHYKCMSVTTPKSNRNNNHRSPVTPMVEENSISQRQVAKSGSMTRAMNDLKSEAFINSHSRRMIDGTTSRSPLASRSRDMHVLCETGKINKTDSNNNIDCNEVSSQIIIDNGYSNNRRSASYRAQDF